MEQLDSLKNIGSGISPNCFGSPLWTSLHLISFGYPDKIVNNQYYDEYQMDGSTIKNTVYNFFKDLDTVIPCKECRKHYKENFNKMELQNHLDSRSSLIIWVYKLHDLVNSQLGKVSPSFEEIINKYSSFLSYNCNSDESVGTCKDSEGYKCKVSFVKDDYNFGDLSTKDIIYILIIIVLVITVIVLIFRRK